jgi:hypothetical protein
VEVDCFRDERGITSAGIAGGNPATFRLYQAVRNAGGDARAARRMARPERRAQQLSTT